MESIRRLFGFQPDPTKGPPAIPKCSAGKELEMIFNILTLYGDQFYTAKNAVFMQVDGIHKTI